MFGNVETFFLNGSSWDKYFQDNLAKLRTFRLNAKIKSTIDSNSGSYWVKFEDISLTDFFDHKNDAGVLSYFVCTFCMRYYFENTRDTGYLNEERCLHFFDSVLTDWDSEFNLYKYSTSTDYPLQFRDLKWTNEGDLEILIVNTHDRFCLPPSAYNPGRHCFGTLHCIPFTAKEICIKTLQSKRVPCITTFCRNRSDLAIANIINYDEL